MFNYQVPSPLNMIGYHDGFEDAQHELPPNNVNGYQEAQSHNREVQDFPPTKTYLGMPFPPPPWFKWNKSIAFFRIMALFCLLIGQFLLFWTGA